MTTGSSGSKQQASQEDDRVVWVHDQRLRRAVLSATEHGALSDSGVWSIQGDLTDES